MLHRWRSPDPAEVLHDAEDRLAARLTALPWLTHEQAAEVGDVLAEVFAELRASWVEGLPPGEDDA